MYFKGFCTGDEQVCNSGIKQTWLQMYFCQTLLLLLKYSSDFNTAVPEYPAEEKAPSGLKSAQWLTCL